MNDSKFEFSFVSSLEKIFFKMPEAALSVSGGSMLKNEIHSFQLAAWAEGNVPQRIPCSVEITSEISEYISVFAVDYVPGMLPLLYGEWKGDHDFLAMEPGLFPDPLRRIRDGRIELSNSQARALWFSVEPDGKVSGNYPVTVTIRRDSGETIGELTYDLTIIDAELPELDIVNTGWFHGDCLSVLHEAPVFSEKYWETVAKYLEVYTKFGHNMVLTPVFTPPLDTAVGGERPTNQLVDVMITDGEYRFGFEKLKRWISLCREKGIRYFEISHLFTQWGAKAAPKVMAVENGETKQIFGWDTSAVSREYTDFLDAFLPELTAFLSEEGVLSDCYFHVSDEPTAPQAEGYLAARTILEKHVDKRRIIDALSDYELYENGTVLNPIVSNDCLQPFMDHRVPDLWTYHCVCQQNFVGNRLMAMPSYRNRVLGWQMYKYNIRGFLQWGFNFWFTQYSLRVIDPYRDTSAGGSFSSGDSFLVYPLDAQGEVVCSLRLYVFNDGLQDLRALRLLEQLGGREAVDKYLTGFEGFTEYPRSSLFYIHLRERLNEEIRTLADR